jgi:hypothetical protein
VPGGTVLSACTAGGRLAPPPVGGVFNRKNAKKPSKIVKSDKKCEKMLKNEKNCKKSQKNDKKQQKTRKIGTINNER